MSEDGSVIVEVAATETVVLVPAPEEADIDFDDPAILTIAGDETTVNYE